MTQAPHPNVQRVADELARHGATGTVQQLAETARTAAMAAEQLGVDIGAIVKSLIFLADGAPVLVLTSGTHQVDTARVAAALGVAALRRADADAVRAATGQPIGGVAPVGHPAPLRTLVDVTLADYPVIWAAGGHPHSVFPTTYAELLTLTAGTPTEVAAG